ncbi:phasin family protein [Desulfothermus sp.]
MFDFFKKAMFAGLGTMVVTKKKVLEVMKKLEEEGKISAKEAESLTKEIIEAGEKELETYKEDINNALKKSLSSLDLVRREEFNEALNRIRELEDRISKLEQKTEGN